MQKILLKKDKNNTVRIWKIKAQDNILDVEYGTLGGKMISKSQVITEGKNIGKKNETSCNQQVISEMESKIRKKRDEGYSSDIDNNKSFSPMLAHEYGHFKDKVIFPCYVQPKLDGYRMIYNGELLTRNNKKYSVMYNTPLHTELKSLGLYLDGELYVHDKNYAFENYGILRRKELKPTDDISNICYYVFDLLDLSLGYQERMNKLLEFKGKFKFIKVVDSFLCKNEQDIEKYHTRFLKDNYEGSMIRNKDSKYICSRSHDLLKYKNFDDDEFRIIGFDYEKKFSDDKLKPVIWKCITKDNKQFDVQCKGTRMERHSLYSKGKDYIGKQITVKFFGYTEEGIPRFPKTLRKGLACFS